MRQKLILALSLAMILVASGCKEEQKASQKPLQVDVSTIKKSDFQTSTSYSASVQGQQDIDIYPQVGGYLQRIAVKEGDEVKKGQLLFVIEQAPYKAAYDAAKANVKVAQAGVATAELNHSSSTLLHEKGIISDAELQLSENSLLSAQAGLSAAQASQASAKVNLDFTEIKSPSAGVVGKLPYRQGALVSPSSPRSLTTVSNNSKMYVYFSMSENQIYNLLDEYGSMEEAVDGMPPLELRLTNGSLYPLEGRLESISGVIDPATGSVSLRATFDNPERRLLSGSRATVVVTKTLENALVIPKAATFELQGKFFVYRIEDGVAKSTPIEISTNSSSREYLVISGLNMGDEIVASGAGLLRDGALVTKR